VSADPGFETFAVGQVARLTGLSPDAIRAWERRHRAVQPLRTPGGTRRYTASDIDRLCLLKRAVDAGHRIAEVVRLPSPELEERVSAAQDHRNPDTVETVLAALDRLDAASAGDLLGGQLAALGPTRFVEEVAAPLVEAMGTRWREERLCVAGEHLGSALLRSFLGAALRPTVVHRDAPIVLFATLAGERHELGLLMAAITALGAVANPLYLGADLPAEELLRAASRSGARAVALSTARGEWREIGEPIAGLRAGLPPSIELWIGGGQLEGLKPEAGVIVLSSLTQLELHVARLRVLAKAGPR
jgi:DNA-binding transcriptional MerR regulator